MKKRIIVLLLMAMTLLPLCAKNYLSLGVGGLYDNVSSSFAVGPYVEYHVLAPIMDPMLFGIGARIDIDFSTISDYWATNAIIGLSMKAELTPVVTFTTLLGASVGLYSRMHHDRGTALTIGGAVLVGTDLFLNSSRNIGLSFSVLANMGVDMETKNFVIQSGVSAGIVFTFNTPERGRGRYHDRPRYEEWDSYNRWH